jgi:hypothetical protein
MIVSTADRVGGASQANHSSSIAFSFSQLTQDANALRHKLPSNHSSSSACKDLIDSNICLDPANCTLPNQNKFGYFPLTSASFASCPNVYVAAAAAAAAASVADQHSSGTNFYGSPTLNSASNNHHHLLDTRTAVLNAMHNARGKKRERQLSNSFNGRFLSFGSDMTTNDSKSDSLSKLNQLDNLQISSSPSMTAAGSTQTIGSPGTAINGSPFGLSTSSTVGNFFASPISSSIATGVSSSTASDAGVNFGAGNSLNCLANAANLAQTGALAAFGYHPAGSYAMGAMDASQLQVDVHSIEKSLIGQHLYGSMATNPPSEYVPKLFPNGTQTGSGWAGTALGYSAAAAAGLNARASYYGCYGNEFDH